MELDSQLLDLIVQFIEYMSDPQNALGIWIAASGLLAGAHLAAPLALDL